MRCCMRQLCSIVKTLRRGIVIQCILESCDGYTNAYYWINDAMYGNFDHAYMTCVDDVQYSASFSTNMISPLGSFTMGVMILINQWISKP